MRLTKSHFLEYNFCKRNLWLKLHRPELFDGVELSEFEQSIIESGNEVERWARKRFPLGVLVESMDPETAQRKTKELMEKKTPAIFQATFVTNHYLIKVDVLEYNTEQDAWNLYEVKGTNSLNESSDKRNHIDDVAFQKVVLDMTGIPVGSIGVLHLNKEYVRQSDIDVADLFEIDEVNDQVSKEYDETKAAMEAAHGYINQEREPELGCECIYKGRSNHCTTFSYSNPDVPGYSVHDLTRIGQSKRKLRELIDDGVYALDDILDPGVLTEKQQNQIEAYLTGRPIIDAEGMQEELGALEYPLYFLDYETYPPAIPLFDGYRPYQHIPFQFSLHIIDEPGTEVRHVEFLHEELSDPAQPLARALQEYISTVGNVIVWHKPFERTINKELGERLPQYTTFFENLNERIYDLKDIVEKQYYVHPEFRGRSSIKKVLPVLEPKFTYSNLAIQDGGAALEGWRHMVMDGLSPEEQREISVALREYCKLDTLAMVLLWQQFQNLF